MEFDEEDISTTERVFTAAFERVTGQHLPKCPPILYLPFAETDVLEKLKLAQVITDEPLKEVKPLSGRLDRTKIFTLYYMRQCRIILEKGCNSKIDASIVQSKSYTRILHQECGQLR